MPGNRQIFEQAMKLGNKYVWDKTWDKAIAEYEKALDEFPNDPIALASAGFVEKAPADVVQRERESLTQLEEQLAAVRSALQALQRSS